MTITAAVIGCGRMGVFTRPDVAATVPPGWLPLAHADAIAATPALTLAALGDPDRAALTRAGLRHPGARLFDDVLRMLHEIRPQLATIATRMPARRSVLEAVAASGVRAIHCEKPFARSAGEADVFAAQLATRNIAFTYGATRRYHPIYRRAARLVADGEIGELREIIIGFGAGRLLWTHAHSVDLILFLAGACAIDWVQAEFAHPTATQGDEIDDDPLLRAATIRLAGGASGSICDLGGCEAIVAGTKGTLRILSDGAALEQLREGKGGYFEHVATIAAEPGASATQVALGELVARMKAGNPTSPELEAARLGTRALMAMVESQRRGGARVRLADVPPDLHVTGRVGALTA
jgi:scyllo-inositol 2-dehydrogenase (NAD+)